jgi:hypothetical protein
MRNPWSDVKSGTQPPLFMVPASSITLQACIDRDNGTIVFGVQAVDPINDQLMALWSSSPVPVERYLKTMHQAHKEWLDLLWQFSGPFAE